MSLIPFAGMIAVWHARTIAWARGLSIGTALLNILLTILLLTLFDHGKTGVQFVEQVSFLGLQYNVGVDGLNILVLALTSITGFLISIYTSISSQNCNQRSSAIILAYQGILTAAFCALNLLQFWFISVWELMLIILLINQLHWDQKKRFLLIRLMQYFGSSLLLILAGFLLLGVRFGGLRT